jgi:hypothetical protein
MIVAANPWGVRPVFYVLLKYAYLLVKPKPASVWALVRPFGDTNPFFYKELSLCINNDPGGSVFQPVAAFSW